MNRTSKSSTANYETRRTPQEVTTELEVNSVMHDRDLLEPWIEHLASLDTPSQDPTSQHIPIINYEDSHAIQQLKKKKQKMKRAWWPKI